MSRLKKCLHVDISNTQNSGLVRKHAENSVLPHRHLFIHTHKPGRNSLLNIETSNVNSALDGARKVSHIHCTIKNLNHDCHKTLLTTKVQN